MVRPTGIEPAHLAPEASALSTELRAHNRKVHYTPVIWRMQAPETPCGVSYYHGWETGTGSFFSR